MSYDGEPWDAPPWWWAVIILCIWLPLLIACASTKSLWIFVVGPSPLALHWAIGKLFPRAFER